MALSSKNQTLSDSGGVEEPDWSDLHADLIYLISQKLTDISDFVSFRVVCKRWRSAVGASDLPPQLPWIMDNCGSFRDGYLRFYSLLTGKTHTINVPQSADKSVRGSAYNYLLNSDWRTRKCSLFNPLTNQELSLPRAKFMFPGCVPSALFPGQSARFVVMSNRHDTSCTPFFLCQPGDHEWTRIKLDPFQSSDRFDIGEFSNKGFTFYDGRCYASQQGSRDTKVIDLTTHTVTHVVPPPEPSLRGVFVYLVASFGMILRVCHYKNYSKTEPSHFRIYRLELDHRYGNAIHPCWVEIDNISNQFLFLHDIHGCAFRADDFPGFVGNNIYFSRENYEEETFELFKYDIKERKTEVLPAPVNLVHHWFVPSLC
ncbi:F-box protein skip23 [Rhynchospora pubera]|uniref:F-box protein skip23 n=1 Tax=Rhynchospora pubera TaxID=906938 RepID=A0AAV8F545_9POAL|nr:F-box protein skip23 [Rhynchospora pubera]KAJ4786102.1 F-box protein skip23 [Rhynchospora pubera]